MKILLTLTIVFLAFADCDAQRSSRIYRPCSGSSTPAKVEVESDGDIDFVPCSGRDVTLNGLSIANGFTVSGSSRTNYFPYFSTQTNLAKSAFSWDGTLYRFNDSAETAQFTLELTPSTAAGRFRVGDFTTTPTAYFDVNQSASSVAFQGNTSNTFSLTGSGIDTTNSGVSWTTNGNINIAVSALGQINLDSNSGTVAIGDVNGNGNTTRIDLNDSAKTFKFNNDTATGVFDLAEIINYFLYRTITAAGTNGNQTINRPAGTVNFAAGAGAAGLTVTNSLVNTGSLVFVVKRTNDATCDVDNVVAGSGSFVITMTANCTAATSVGFLVTN